MFSKTCEYAIRAVLFIAQQSEEGTKVSIKAIAKGIDAPEFFTAKILQDLSRQGLIQSLKGPTGGFYLHAGSGKFTLADVVRTVDGNKLFTGCALGLAQCSAKKPCPLHNSFVKLREEIREALESVKLGDFNKALEQGLFFLKR